MPSVCNLGGPDARAEAEGRHDRELVGGVVAFDVVRGVGLGVAELLGGGERCIVAALRDGFDALAAEGGSGRPGAAPCS